MYHLVTLRDEAFPSKLSYPCNVQCSNSGWSVIGKLDRCVVRTIATTALGEAGRRGVYKSLQLYALDPVEESVFFEVALEDGFF